MALTPELPAATAGDWWVTTDQSLALVQQHGAAARTAPDLSATLAEIGRVRTAADAALGAAVRALLASGHDWDGIAAALGLPDAAAARRATADAVRRADQALEQRLGPRG
ncbi:hypothetical protein C3486_17945 [Streptomyces sp. Ru73]|uniref:hypothetical protein n=1 Tax=Streptomyces sp. Ru73 TaxID=2080748 RepID=UPI000CDCECBA|nr:hypothetical protein [Streptomyces sp. Ru73]POX39530.1 hypothetical protein C3486_17945 [Streptomyces sp. Ru73]